MNRPQTALMLAQASSCFVLQRLSPSSRLQYAARGLPTRHTAVWEVAKALGGLGRQDPDNPRLADEFVLQKDKELVGSYWENLRRRGRFNFYCVFSTFTTMALWNCENNVNKMGKYNGWTLDKMIGELGDIRARRHFRPVEDKAKLLDQIHTQCCTDGRSFAQFYVELLAELKRDHSGGGCCGPIWMGFSDGHPFRSALMAIAGYFDRPGPMKNTLNGPPWEREVESARLKVSGRQPCCDRSARPSTC
ncbi:unnamed protein product [Vitrella brassicaformis CCMP3155]|uniref:Uncharacterized protein n=1 Tax=Vitrella brassicaformis (strain CCMP3155) TaxID=1169540 RepID=A0A0G4GZN3_VITBC|nr:unnamed protein product [Vitrella brassicaformis CCMP3155]|mmetsp:Transcript_30800/g.89588  ORF Transcript_30800/g.89588 Transcript_30800/m.89588 type:complete len:248 (+) Transcript_30800:140-883(+)|eukprot:CEM36497.1 unnamed protein product [Vitrella brassicaformis CCMP3155]